MLRESFNKKETAFFRPWLRKTKRFCPQNQFAVKQLGFTLIEMLVVFLIVVSLSVLLLAAYRTGQKKYALSQASQQLISDLRRAQNMAMGGIEIKGQYCGYGLVIKVNTPTSYLFYADISADCQSSNNKYDSSDNILETVNLPQGISIESVSPSPKIDIFFKPPQPTTYINQDDSPGQSGSITLQIEGASLTKTVTVTTAGLIESVSSGGGGAPANGSCQGTPTACSSFGGQISCQDQDGCSWNPGSCTGACASCGSLDYSDCFSQDGCYWRWGRCRGTCTSCDNYGSSGDCSGQIGCSWSSDYCSGTATLCGNYTSQSTCSLQDGCSWL